MAVGSALKSVLTKFIFQMDGGKLAAVNIAAGRTQDKFAKAAGQAEFLQNKINSVMGRAKLLAGTLLGGLGLKSVTVDVANTALEVDRMSKALGVTTDFYQGLQFAIDTTTNSGEQASQVIADISERMFDASEGSKALADDFKLLGFSRKKLKALAAEGPEAQILAMADAVKAAGPSAKRTFTVMSGLSDTGMRLIPMLAQGSEGLKKMMVDAKRLGVVLDKDAIKQAKVFSQRMILMKARLKGVRNQIGMRLLPTVNDMVAAFSAWISEGDNVNKMLYAMAVAAGVAGVALASMMAPRVIASFKLFAKQLAGILKLLKGITLQAALAKIKLMALVAGLIFVGLVIEDLVNFVRGDKSVTEQLFGRSEVIIDGLLSIRDTFMEMLDELESSFAMLWASIVALAGAFGIKLTTFKALIKTIGKLIFMFVVAAIIAMGNALSGVLWVLGKIIEAVAWLIRLLVDGMLDAVNGIKRAWVDLVEEMESLFIRIQDAAFSVANSIGAFFRAAARGATKAWSKFSNFLDRIKNKAASLATRGKNIILRRTEEIDFDQPRPPGGPPGARPSTTSNTTNNVGGIVVNAAPGQNPKEIAAEVQRRLINTTYRDLVPDTGAGGAGPTVFD